MKWVIRSSAVRVSDARGDRLYTSLADAPEELRRKIGECVAAKRTQTVLIANQEAYDRILSGQGEIPAELQRLRPALQRHRSAKPQPARPDSRSGEWKGLAAGGFALIVLMWALWLWALHASMQ